jgi:heat shock protein HtpX
VSSIAAAIGMAITFIARMAFWFGDDDDNPLGAVGAIAMLILAPLAAALIQMAVSRSREYQADESGAYLSHDPEALASALLKLESAARQVPPPANLQPAEAHMFIVNPLAGLRGRGFTRLFMSHPPTEDRVARLQAISREIRGGSPIG